MKYLETDNEIYFYSHKKYKYSCFSNFYESYFIEDNIEYCNLEQYFMYNKCLLFDKNNNKLLNNILNEKSPTKIKKYGRQVKNYNDEIWNEKRYVIMKKALILKFSQNEDIKKILLETNNKILYEASKFDKIWGIGYSPDKVINVDKNKFGKNLLGLCLMEVRNLLKNI